MRFILFFIAGLLMTAPGFSQKAEVIKFQKLEDLIASKGEQIQVINFWATWCAPCIKELPFFEKLNVENKEVKVTLVTLDYADKLDKVNSFISKRKMASKVWLLDELDYNSWIDKVEKTWSGAIPATLIINPKTGKRLFVERELKEGELEKLIADIK